MTSREDEMRKKLNYCYDRGASLAQSLRSTSRPVVPRQLQVYKKIDKVDRSLPAETQLRKRVVGAQCEISPTRRVTYPQSLLRALGDESRLVERYLEGIVPRSRRGPEPNLHALAKRICKSYTKIFAILIQVHLPSLIIEFVNQRIDDTFLPLEYQEVGGRDGAVSQYRKRTWFEVSDMDRDDWDSFCNKQSTHMVPFFAFTEDNDILHYKFESWDIIPITSTLNLSNSSASSDGEISPIDGGHSIVTRIELDPVCSNFGDYRFRHKMDWYALKTLKDKSQWRDFLAEVYFWKLWNEKGGSKLEMSPLLCTWEQKDEHGNVHYCLLFPYASGDLRKLWGRAPTQFNERWLIHQCWRLAETLSFIHHDSEKHQAENDGDPETLFGRHGDIKPENILWFAEHTGCDKSGTLVLADFGVSKCHRANTRSQSNNWRTKNSPTYRAPEYDLPGHKIGRKADVWALGCTWLEFATWFLKGSTSVNSDFQDFRGKTDPNDSVVDEDSFFMLASSKKSAIVKSEVNEWVSTLRAQENCSAFFEEFLQYIMTDMLVVDEKSRAAACDVADKLEKLCRVYAPEYC